MEEWNLIPMRTPEERLADCQKALEYYKNPANENTGICIILGVIAYGSFMNCPWWGWKSLKERYPEVAKSQAEPAASVNWYSVTAQEASAVMRVRRVEILENAILQLQSQLSADGKHIGVQA